MRGRGSCDLRLTTRLCCRRGTADPKLALQTYDREGHVGYQGRGQGGKGSAMTARESVRMLQQLKEGSSYAERCSLALELLYESSDGCNRKQVKAETVLSFAFLSPNTRPFQPPVAFRTAPSLQAYSPTPHRNSRHARPPSSPFHFPFEAPPPASQRPSSFLALPLLLYRTRL